MFRFVVKNEDVNLFFKKSLRSLRALRSAFLFTAEEMQKSTIETTEAQRSQRKSLNIKLIS